MRLPISKVYRAFPELDKFDDARCQAYVRNVKRAGGWRRHVFGAACGAAAILAFIALAAAFAIAWHWAFDWLGWSARRWTHEDWYLFLMLAFVVGIPMAIGAVVAFVLRDLMLRRALRRHISGSRCPDCNYLLLGLVPKDGEIRCPECGTLYALTELGLTPDDLLPV